MLRYEFKGTVPEHAMKRRKEDDGSCEAMMGQARELYRGGMTIKDIEKTFGVRHGTFKKAGLKNPETPDMVSGDAGPEADDR